MLVGVLSDTHSALHPKVIPIFRGAGVELILHAGDVGDYSIIRELENLAPVHAVAGNVDMEGEVAELPQEVALDLEGASIYMTHIGGKPFDWAPLIEKPKPSVAICGHSHAPLVEQVGPTLFLNPGAAGTRHRFHLPLACALLRIENGHASAELMMLD